MLCKPLGQTFFFFTNPIRHGPVRLAQHHTRQTPPMRMPISLYNKHIPLQTSEGVALIASLSQSAHSHTTYTTTGTGTGTGTTTTTTTPPSSTQKHPDTRPTYTCTTCHYAVWLNCSSSTVPVTPWHPRQAHTTAAASNNLPIPCCDVYTLTPLMLHARSRRRWP
jgi:hypothetical protein